MRRAEADQVAAGKGRYVHVGQRLAFELLTNLVAVAVLADDEPIAER
jgi:hypothetical protein